MRIRFLGSGDAFGSGGRFQTCFLVSGEASTFLVDCGASSLIAMRRFGVDPNAVDTVFVSHLHVDHFGGLPFLVLDGQLVSRRTRPLTFAGPPGLRQRLHDAMELFFPGSTRVERKFQVEVIELEPEVRTVVNGVAVTPWVVKHACGAPPFALRLEAEGRTLAYSGDTEWVENLIPAARGADLFVAEAYFRDRQVRFHLDYASLASRLGEIAAKRVVLTHMGPDMLGRGAGELGGCTLADDGLELSF